MGRIKRQTNNTEYLSEPKTSATMRIKGENYIVESYYIGKKNIHDTIIKLAEKKAYEEMYENEKIKGGCGGRTA